MCGNFKTLQREISFLRAHSFLPSLNDLNIFILDEDHYKNKGRIKNQIYESFLAKEKEPELEIDKNDGLITKEESKQRIFCLVCTLTFFQVLMLSALVLWLQLLSNSKDSILLLSNQKLSGTK